mgnify:CR=1 FL=1
MNNKVIIEVTCPYCKSKLMLRKNVEVATKRVTCPENGCGKELHIMFDVTQNPQTYKILNTPDEKEPDKKGKTVYKKNEDSGEKEDIGTQKKKTIYGKDRNKTPHNVYNDLDDDDDEDVKPKKRHRLRERIYLTHITWFGLRNHRFQLYEGTTTIGRYDEDDTSDIMIRGDEAMSRRSVAIIIEEEDGVFDYKLKVLNATNKVKVNDQRVKEGAEVYLDFGDIIMLGNSKFKFDNH